MCIKSYCHQCYNELVKSKVLLMTTYCLRPFVVLQALNIVASEVMVGDTCDTCIPSLIVINTTINQLETDICDRPRGKGP